MKGCQWYGVGLDHPFTDMHNQWIALLSHMAPATQQFRTCNDIVNYKSIIIQQYVIGLYDTYELQDNATLACDTVAEGAEFTAQRSYIWTMPYALGLMPIHLAKH